MVVELVLDAAPLTAGEYPQQIGLRAVDIPRYLTGGNQVGHANQVTVNEDGTISLSNSRGNTGFVDGDVGIAGEVKAQDVTLMAANRVNPTNPELIRTDNGDYSAPTVVLFPNEDFPDLAYTFIDSTVEDYQTLLYGGVAGTVSFIVTPEENGITLIGDRLSQLGEQNFTVDSLNIVAEGNGGNFWLGKSFVSHHNLAQYQEQFQRWQTGLGPEADLLLYSCFTALGMHGQAFVNSLAARTGADVAASTNLTGNAQLGGDWHLEYQTGNIEATTPFTAGVQEFYQGTLDTLTVDTTADDTITGNTNGDGLLNLREALEASNNDSTVEGQTGSGTDTIRFDPTAFAGMQTITLTNGELEISDDVTIEGTGQNNLSIDANHASRVFSITANNVTLKDITITKGEVTGNGGGINFAGTGTLTLENSTVSGNSATGSFGGFGGDGGDGGNGGGIFADSGALTLTNSTVSGNSATGGIGGNGGGNGGNGGNGGGIFANTGALTLTNSTVSGNSVAGGRGGRGSIGGIGGIGGNGGNGGGIFANTGALTLTNSTVSGNSVTGGGGGYSGGNDSYNGGIGGNGHRGLRKYYANLYGKLVVAQSVS
ncbi:MAG: DUF4347 domain-containing protein, partial [Symploca sp. SIO3E6]|nr:DUF4347 domain-containing protein [Caldora sp. SIO3E6]